MIRRELWTTAKCRTPDHFDCMRRLPRVGHVRRGRSARWPMSFTIEQTTMPAIDYAAKDGRVSATPGISPSSKLEPSEIAHPSRPRLRCALPEGRR